MGDVESTGVDVIRVFAGVAPNHEDIESQSVFEWSLRKHSSEPVELYWLKMRREGLLSGWDSSKWATPFTAFRWAVPELSGFYGKAIYCDSDFIFFDDIAKLYRQPIPDLAIALALSPKRMCIVLWDCAKARRFIPPIASLRTDPNNNISMKTLFMSNSSLLAPFVGKWNCVEGEGVNEFTAAEVQAVHYSSVPHQLHLHRAKARLAKEGREHWFKEEILQHPNAKLRVVFDDLLKEAEQKGYGPMRYTGDPFYGAYTTRTAASLWIHSLR